MAAAGSAGPTGRGAQPRPPGPEGLLLVDKPAGWTSHDVVARTRRIAGQRRLGHTGTLDPAATGLLVLCLGRATRLVEYLTGHDKVYEGTIRLGVRTDTDDAEGTATATAPPPALDPAALAALAEAFTGPILQRPPVYSAVKVAGERAYAAARRGSALDLPPRPVRVHALRLEQLEPGLLALHVRCGAGTYVRSLARDIGEQLGCGAHLASLRRLVAGPFAVADAWTLGALERAAAEGTLADLVLPADEGLAGWPAALLGPPSRAALIAGRTVNVAAEEADVPLVRAYDAGGELIGIARLAEGRLRPIKTLIPQERTDPPQIRAESD